MSSSILNGAIAPLIPGSGLFKTVQTDVAKITEIVGSAVADFSAWKETARAATTVNITLTAAQTVDAVVLAAGDIVLVKNQTDASENGLYVVSASNWVRTLSLPVGADASGFVTYVTSGTANGGRAWICTNLPGAAIVDTSNLTFAVFANTYSSAKAGTAVLVSGTVTVSTNVVLATGDRIVVSRRTKNSSTAIGPLQALISATGTSGVATFTISALNVASGATLVADVSTVDWIVVSSAAFT